MSLSHSQLRRWYLSFNRRWFGGELPEDMQVFYAPDDHVHEWAIEKANGECFIKVDTLLMHTRWAKMGLLHGMNHHYTGDWTHGARFQAGMQRLAKAGALKNIW